MRYMSTNNVMHILLSEFRLGSLFMNSSSVYCVSDKSHIQSAHFHVTEENTFASTLKQTMLCGVFQRHRVCAEARVKIAAEDEETRRDAAERHSATCVSLHRPEQVMHEITERLPA